MVGSVRGRRSQKKRIQQRKEQRSPGAEDRRDGDEEGTLRGALRRPTNSSPPYICPSGISRTSISSSDGQSFGTCSLRKKTTKTTRGGLSCSDCATHSSGKNTMTCRMRCPHADWRPPLRSCLSRLMPNSTAPKKYSKVISSTSQCIISISSLATPRTPFTPRNSSKALNVNIANKRHLRSSH